MVTESIVPDETPGPRLYAPWRAREQYGEPVRTGIWTPWQQDEPDWDDEDEDVDPDTPATPVYWTPWQAERQAWKTEAAQIRVHHKWDDLPGVEMTADSIALMEPDLLERDDFSLWERQEAWGQAEEVHQASRANGSPRPGQFGAYMVSGRMGGNKSHWIVTELLEAHLAGIPIFHNDSLGAFFGRRLTLVQCFDFMNLIPAGTMMGLDEIVGIIDRYGSQAHRNRTFSSSMAAFRKKFCTLFGASALEHLVGAEFRAACEGVIEPYTYTPTRLDGFGRRVQRQFRAPPWCHVKARMLKAPWKGTRIWDDYRNYLAGNTTKDQREGDRWEVEYMRHRPPKFYWLAALLYDTFARVPDGAVFDIDSEAMKAQRAEREGRGQKGGPAGAGEVGEDGRFTGVPTAEALEFQETLKWFLQQGPLQNLERQRSASARKMQLKELVVPLQQAGWKISVRKIRGWLLELGALPGKERISIDELKIAASYQAPATGKRGRR